MILNYINVIIFFITILINNNNYVNSAIQCNLGLKMFSMENGNAVCAPFSSFKCIESCEWNTSCSLTSHYTAFRGRRTYVSGMLISGKNFLVQCCASLGTIVQMNVQQEPICVWVPIVETVNEHGSVRFEPPLASNEYIREVLIERVGQGRVNVNVQICKYVIQRTTCDKRNMSNEESHFYSLLLLRLSRTKDFLNSASGFRGTQRDSLLDSFHDELPLRNRYHHLLARHSPSPNMPRALSQSIQIPQNSINNNKNVARMITGEAGDNDDSMEIPYTKDNGSSRTSTINAFVEANESKTLVNIDPTTKNNDSIFRRDSLIFSTNQTSSNPHQQQHRKAHANRQYGVKKDLNGENYHMLRLPPPSNTSISIPSNSNLAIQPSHLAFASSDYISSRGWPFKLKQHKTWPISLTNTTHEMIPAPYWPIGERGLNLQGHIMHNEAGTSQLAALRRRQLLHVEELPVKSELAIKKLNNENLKLEHKLEHTSYGGSFAAPAINPPFREENHENLISSNLHIPTSSFAKAPPFKIIPTVDTQSSTIMKRPYIINNKNPKLVPIKQRNEEVEANNNKEIAFKQQKSSALMGLLDCCQRTAPGCKNLCSKDVNKDAIKKALINQQCPPLSMTSVIQCFPRFYNVSSVATCCTKATNNAALNEKANLATPIEFTYSLKPSKFPQQCLSLCSPNFKLTFAHFACIDHIEHIVECYRSLMV